MCCAFQLLAKPLEILMGPVRKYTESKRVLEVKKKMFCGLETPEES